MSTQTSSRPVGVDELKRAWDAVNAGEFRTGPGAGKRPRGRGTAATDDWSPAAGEHTIAVIGCAGSVGASTIALAAGLHHAEKLAGIIALSTYLPAYVVQPGERSAANAAIPIFWGHGSVDPVVVMQRGTDSRDLLQSLGYAVQWHTYLMAHAVCPEEIGDLRHWLGQRLA